MGRLINMKNVGASKPSAPRKMISGGYLKSTKPRRKQQRGMKRIGHSATKSARPTCDPQGYCVTYPPELGPQTHPCNANCNCNHLPSYANEHAPGGIAHPTDLCRRVGSQ